MATNACGFDPVKSNRFAQEYYRGPMPLDSRDSSVFDLLCKIVLALVDRTEAVQITPTPQTDGVCFSVEVHSADTGKMIGRQGGTAKSLRIVFSAIGTKMRRRYSLNIVE